jgi:glycerol-3-phosphate dehydrogenase
LSVFGGKLTTYRKLAQAACNKLKPGSARWGMTGPPTAGCPVASSTARCELARAFALEFDWLDDRSALRIAEAYGAHARLWLQEERGQHFGAGLYESEVRYLIEREWAHSWKTFCGAAASWGCACRKPNSSNWLPGSTPPRPARSLLMTQAGGL